MEALVGRKNLVRLARSLTMAVRRDVANEMETNGELMVQQVVLRHAGAGPVVVFDVGANVGDWSKRLLASAGDPDLQVHAFEPASATFGRLADKLKFAGERVRLVRQALSSQTGTAQFYIAGEGLGINSLHVRSDRAAGQETVTLNTVDQYCKESCLNHIHLLKIDAEGHDFAVLEGASGMLAARSISVIQFEYNALWVHARHYLKDAFTMLQPLGYSLGKVTPKGIEFYPTYQFELESFCEGNYLACLQDWVPRFPQVKWWNLE